MRILQGVGDASLSIAGNLLPFITPYTGYVLITIKYPERKKTYLGFCSTARGLGVMSGPLLGQLIYNALEFEKTFYIFAGIISPFLLLSILWIPRELNRKGI